MRAPSHAVRRAGRAPRQHAGRQALVMLLTALTALVPLVGNAPASAAGTATRSAASAPAFGHTATTTASSSGSESRRSTRVASRATTSGAARRLDTEPGPLAQGQPRHRSADTGLRGVPATGGADPTGPPHLLDTGRCATPDPLPLHRFLPVGSGRSPPTTCGS
ncbi:MAG: hypothetical protein ACXV2H_06180 [Actinomycetes bacterium]